MNKFLVRNGRGWVFAWHTDSWLRLSLKRNLYGYALWVGPLGVGFVR